SLGQADRAFDSYDTGLHDAAFGRHDDEGFQATLGKEHALDIRAGAAKFLSMLQVNELGVPHQQLLAVGRQGPYQCVLRARVSHCDPFDSLITPRKAEWFRLGLPRGQMERSDPTPNSSSTAATKSCGKKGFSKTRRLRCASENHFRECPLRKMILAFRANRVSASSKLVVLPRSASSNAKSGVS